MVESIMEHIAKVVGKDAIEVRLANMNPGDREVLQPMIEELMKTADYEKRKKAVESFNEV